MQCATVNAKEIDLSRSKLIQLVQHLEVADSELKIEFVRIALIEMYNAYQFELRRSQKQLPENRKKQLKIHRWRLALLRFMDTIEQQLFNLDTALTLDFFISPEHKLIVLLNQQPFIINGPNDAGNKVIEKNIVDAFCEYTDCTEYFYETGQPEISSNNKQAWHYKEHQNFQPAKQVINPDGYWSIKEGGLFDFIAAENLIIRFNSIVQRYQKEQWAIQFTEEVKLLEKNFSVLKAKGSAIDWSRLKLKKLAYSDSVSKIILNEQGDFIKAPIPLINRNPELFKLVLPWLKARFDNTIKSRSIIVNAELFYYDLQE
jgi:hypothetical protein